MIKYYKLTTQNHFYKIIDGKTWETKIVITIMNQENHHQLSSIIMSTSSVNSLIKHCVEITKTEFDREKFQAEGTINFINNLTE